MNRLMSTRLATALASAAALPASAHLSGQTAAHWHAGDVWGVLAVLALTAAAAWLDRRGR